jgi:hypothetical protein
MLNARRLSVFHGRMAEFPVDVAVVARRHERLHIGRIGHSSGSEAVIEVPARGQLHAAVGRAADLAKKYTANWEAHCRHSEPYEAKEKGCSETVQPADPAPVAADGYLASKNSEVFHRPDCKSAAKIAERNVVKYNTRDEAVQAGKGHCAECQP